MSPTRNSVALAAYAPRAYEREVARGSAAVAFGGLLLFIAVLYANPGNWFDAVANVGFAKIAAGFSLIALGASWLLYNRRLTLGGAPGIALALLFVIVGLSPLWSLWPSQSFATFADGIKYFAIFFLTANVIDSRGRLHKIVAALAWATAIPALGCIYSWAHGEYLVEGDRAGWIGLFGNPNDLAYYLVAGVAMALAARDATRSRIFRLLYLALIVTLGVAVALTQSRGGMLAGGTVALLWAVRSVRRAPALIGLVLAFIGICSLAPRDPWKARARSSVAFGEDASAQGRIDAWRTGLAIAEERPLTGVGAGAFMVAWPSFAPGDAGPARTEHNTVVEILAELGAPALLLFLFAFGAGVRGLSRAARDPALSTYARGTQCGLAGFAVCSLSGGLAFSWPFYLLLGIAVATRRLTPCAASTA